MKTYYIYIEETACNQQTQIQQLNVQKMEQREQLTQMENYLYENRATMGNVFRTVAK